MAKKNHHQQKPAQKEEPKGLLARAAEAIDHAIHPEAEPKSEPDLVQSSEAAFKPLPDADQTEKVSEPAAKTYREHQAAWPSKKDLAAEKATAKKSHRCPNEESDLKQHPKFSKFKKGVN